MPVEKYFFTVFEIEIIFLALEAKILHNNIANKDLLTNSEPPKKSLVTCLC